MAYRQEDIVTQSDRERGPNRLVRVSFWIALGTALAYLGVAIEDARAASLRCGNDLVQRGDSYLDVTDACGKPAREVALVGEDDQRVGTALYYKGGYGKADRKVYLRGGTVTGIERLN